MRNGYEFNNVSFKPCYKWIAFNTYNVDRVSNGEDWCFKPCYKWIAFNTEVCFNFNYKTASF